MARRENSLRQIAAIAMEIGSPEAIIIPADVSKSEDCKAFVDATVNHFTLVDVKNQEFNLS